MDVLISFWTFILTLGTVASYLAICFTYPESTIDSCWLVIVKIWGGLAVAVGSFVLFANLVQWVVWSTL